MALSGALLQAIHRYGPSVDHLARSHYGISGQALLAKLIKGESGGRGGAVSNAGARGYAQFMPGTRASVKAKYGIDPWRSPDEAVHAAALHLRGKVTGHAGLEGYNPGGGQGYVDYILGQPVGNVSKGSRRAARAGGMTVGSIGAPQTPSLSPGGTGLADLLAAQMQRPQAQASLPTPPSFTRQPVMPKGYQQVQFGGPPVSQQGASLDDLLSAAGSLQGPDLHQPAQAFQTPTKGAGHGSANSSGTRRYHGPLFELFWQGPGGINIKNGQREPMGFVKGHTEHVHVAAGPKMVVRLGNLAEKMGLSVGENPHFGGVNPVHVKNSYHYRDRAIDVSGTPQQMARYAHTVARLMLR